MQKFAILFAFLNLIFPSSPYKVPEAKFEVFQPRGFRVSIPEDGNSLFAFHGKLNRGFDGLEAGTWSVDIPKAVNGRFTYTNWDSIIKIGDVMYYWTYVIRDRLGFRHDNGEFRVTEYSDNPDDKKSSALPPPNANNVLSEENPPLSNSSNLGEIFSQSSCNTRSVSSVNDIQLSCPGNLLFEENFNEESLNPGKWRMERRIPGAPDYEFNIYLDKTESLVLTNGTAIMKTIVFDDVYGKNAIKEGFNLDIDCTGELNTTECQREAHDDNILPPLITSQFSTIHSFNFRYGRVEVRAKLPSGDWVFPQMFLNPVDHKKYGKENYSSGQLRVVQSDGNCKIRNGAILSDKEPFRSVKTCSRTCVKNGEWHTQFHNFTMVWLPDSIKFFVDGVSHCVVGGDLCSTTVAGLELPTKDILKRKGETSLAPFDVNFYITLGYGVGGINDFADEGGKPWRNDDRRGINKFWRNINTDWADEKYKFEIDYIRVYAV